MPIFSGRCYSKVRLDGQTVVITGCNTGIGKENVKEFYKRGAHVVMACRNKYKAYIASKEIMEVCEGMEGLGSIVITELDLSSLASVRECAKHIMETESKINILINNAGVMLCPEAKTEDGFEMQFGTNHLGHFLFTMLLMPKIIESTPARIVNVSSDAHYRGKIEINDLNFENRPYSPLGAYDQSKLANVMFTKELVRQLRANKIEGINVYVLNPGVVNTELVRHLDKVYYSITYYLWNLISFFVKSPELGSQTTTFCAIDEKCDDETGLYYSDCIPVKPHRGANNREMCQKLWHVSWKMVGLGDWNPFEKK